MREKPDGASVFIVAGNPIWFRARKEFTTSRSQAFRMAGGVLGAEFA